MGLTCKPEGRLKRIYKRLENDMAKKEKEKKDKNEGKHTKTTKGEENAQGTEA